MRLLLVRHGEGQCNVDETLDSLACRGLTAAGLEEATGLASALADRTDAGDLRLISSPVPRAIQTAELIADRSAGRTGRAFPIELADDLRAQDREPVPGYDGVPPRVVESIGRFTSRIGRHVRRLGESPPPSGSPSTNVLVTHGRVILIALSFATGSELWHPGLPKPANGSITELVSCGDGPGVAWDVVSYDDSTFLGIG